MSASAAAHVTTATPAAAPVTAAALVPALSQVDDKSDSKGYEPLASPTAHLDDKTEDSGVVNIANAIQKLKKIQNDDKNKNGDYIVPIASDTPLTYRNHTLERSGLSEMKTLDGSMMYVAGELMQRAQGLSGHFRFPLTHAKKVEPGKAANTTSAIFSIFAASKALVGNLQILSLLQFIGIGSYIVAIPFAIPAMIFYHDSASILFQRLINKIKECRDPKKEKPFSIEEISVGLSAQIQDFKEAHDYTPAEWASKFLFGTFHGIGQAGMVLSQTPADLDIPYVKEVVIAALFVANMLMGTDKTDQLNNEVKSVFTSKENFVLQSEIKLYFKAFHTLYTFVDAYFDKHISKDISYDTAKVKAAGEAAAKAEEKKEAKAQARTAADVKAEAQAKEAAKAQARTAAEAKAKAEAKEAAKAHFRAALLNEQSTLKISQEVLEADKNYIRLITFIDNLDFGSEENLKRLKVVANLHCREILLSRFKQQIAHLSSGANPNFVLQLVDAEVNKYQVFFDTKKFAEKGLVYNEAKDDERVDVVVPSAAAPAGVRDDAKLLNSPVVDLEYKTVNALKEKIEYFHVVKGINKGTEAVVAGVSCSVAAGAVTSNISGIYNVLCKAWGGELGALGYVPASFFCLAALSLNLEDTRKWGDKFLGMNIFGKGSINPVIKFTSENCKCGSCNSCQSALTTSLTQFLKFGVAMGASASGGYYTAVAGLFPAWASYVCAACSFLLTTTTKLPAFEKLVKEKLLCCLIATDNKLEFNKEVVAYYDSQIMTLMSGIDESIKHFNAELATLKDEQRQRFGFDKIDVYTFTQAINVKLQAATDRKEIYTILVDAFYDLRSQCTYVNEYKKYYASRLEAHITYSVFEDDAGNRDVRNRSTNSLASLLEREPATEATRNIMQL